MNKCRVCDQESDGKIVVAKEMMYENAGHFEYFECPNCGCLQIANIPDNLADFYSNKYYSFSTPTDTKTLGKTAQVPKRILDIGCGSGELLSQLAKMGHKDLTGCDPFIEKDLSYENGVKIFKKSVHEIEGQFDLIMLNDSFEHMSDPHEVMDSLKKILAPKGIIKMTLPIYPNLAFDTYKENWYQLDAPRHILLHSRNSLEILADKHGLKIAQMVFDSNNSAILRSFLYQKGVTFWKQKPEEIFNYFNKKQIEEINAKVAHANKKGYGDHASVYFIHA